MTRGRLCDPNFRLKLVRDWHDSFSLNRQKRKQTRQIPRISQVFPLKMTVIYRENDCILIQHNRQVHSYQDSDGTLTQLQLKQLLFENFKRKGKSKQPPKSMEELSATDTSLRGKVETFLASLKSERLFLWRDATSIDSFKKANIELLNKFYADSSQPLENFHGENNLAHGKNVSMNNIDFLIPPRCRFYNKSIESISSFLNPSSIVNKFDFVVIDPPWQNRYIKRVKKKTDKLQGYQTMSDEEIAQIPLANYLTDNALVVCWCTNAESHIQSFKTEICTRWKLKLLSTWFWMKIDANGELFNEFNGNKRPYERIFIATNRENCNKLEKLQEDLLIFSQPSAIHSHKPPLIGEIAPNILLHLFCIQLSIAFSHPNQIYSENSFQMTPTAWRSSREISMKTSRRSDSK